MSADKPRWLISVFIALFLLGFLALGLDVGYLFHEKRMAQAAADAAAVAAAEEAEFGEHLKRADGRQCDGADEWV